MNDKKAQRKYLKDFLMQAEELEKSKLFKSKSIERLHVLYLDGKRKTEKIKKMT